MHEFEIGIKIVNPQFPVFVSASAVALGDTRLRDFSIHHLRGIIRVCFYVVTIAKQYDDVICFSYTDCKDFYF